MHSKGLIGDRTQIVRLLALMYVPLTVVSVLIRRKKFGTDVADLVLYYESALKLLQGKLPYSDFPLEYPPLALLPMTLPQLVNFGQVLGFRGYVCLFWLENVIFTTLIALLLLQVRRYWQPKQRSLWILKAYIILVTISTPLLPWRFDLFPALLTLLALLFILFERPTIAGIWLGLAIAAKLYPLVLLPIFGAYYLASRKYHSLIKLVLGCVGATCIVMLPFALTAGGEMLSFLRYHQLRGLQVESFPAGILCLAHVLQLTKVSLVFNYGAFHLVSPLAAPILKWLPLISILSFVGVISSCLSCFRREYRTKGTITVENLVIYTIAALWTFMIVGKVFSPQYIIWLLPFAPLLRPRQFWLMAAIFAMSILIFPIKYHLLLQLQVPWVVLLNLRNLLVVVLLLWLLIETNHKVGRNGLNRHIYEKIGNT